MINLLFVCFSTVLIYGNIGFADCQQAPTLRCASLDVVELGCDTDSELTTTTTTTTETTTTLVFNML